MTLESLEASSQLQNFFSTIYDDLEGYIYLAFKSSPKSTSVVGKTAWRQEFYKYPEEVPAAISSIRKNSQKYEVYYAPSLFTKKEAKKNLCRRI
jgi:hypothetical protein